jgi:hypothetical protein
MKTMHVVQAHGGDYDDTWTSNLCICKTEQKALELCILLERWIKEIREQELPEALEEHSWDLDDDRQMEMRQEALDEFMHQVLLDMQVPEQFHEFVLENQVEPFRSERDVCFSVDEVKVYA